jgi:hypothetical protein
LALASSAGPATTRATTAIGTLTAAISAVAWPRISARLAIVIAARIASATRLISV